MHFTKALVWKLCGWVEPAEGTDAVAVGDEISIFTFSGAAVVVFVEFSPGINVEDDDATFLFSVRHIVVFFKANKSMPPNSKSGPPELHGKPNIADDIEKQADIGQRPEINRQVCNTADQSANFFRQLYSVCKKSARLQVRTH
jgi:hypothetical protein